MRSASAFFFAYIAATRDLRRPRFGRRLALPGFGSPLSRSRWLALSSFRLLPCHCALADGTHPAAAPTSQPRRRASNRGLARQRNYPARPPRGNGAATQSRHHLLNCGGFMLVALQCLSLWNERYHKFCVSAVQKCSQDRQICKETQIFESQP